MLVKVFIIVVVVAALVGCVILSGKLALPSSNTAPSSTPTPSYSSAIISTPQSTASISRSPAPTVNTSTWKTYRNDQWGFIVKYPQDWILDEAYKAKGIIWLRTREKQNKINEGLIVRLFDIEIKIYSSSSELPNNHNDSLPFQQWIAQKASKYGFTRSTPIIINGVSGYQGVALRDTTTYSIFVEYDKKIYEINTGEMEIPTANEEGIINSFKFIK
jgi:hypothetical protein